MRCPRCKKLPVQKHFNSKWCKPCADFLKHRPQHKLTLEQQRLAKKFAGTMDGQALAKRVGRSLSSLRRWARDTKTSFAFHLKYKCNPKLVQEVCEYYERYGKVKTFKHFPGISFRSIVERYPHIKRQERWKGNQLIELVKMAGIISPQAQAQYFMRPRANDGSIKAVWVKKFKQNGGKINGLPWNICKDIVGPSITAIKTEFWTQRKPYNKRSNQKRRVFLWIDIQQALKKKVDPEVRSCVTAMAKFQKWLHGKKNTKQAILRMIEEREPNRNSP